MTLKTLTRVGGTVLVCSTLVTGLQFKQGSLAHQAARFLVGEPLKASREVLAFAKGILEDGQQEREKKPSNEEGSGNPGKEAPRQPEHSRAAPEVLDVVPSADGTINVKTRLDKQLINVAVDRAQVEALQARPSPQRVDIAFTVRGHRYTAEIDKDMLIAALASR